MLDGDDGEGRAVADEVGGRIERAARGVRAVVADHDPAWACCHALRIAAERDERRPERARVLLRETTDRAARARARDRSRPRGRGTTSTRERRRGSAAAAATASRTSLAVLADAARERERVEAAERDGHRGDGLRDAVGVDARSRAASSSPPSAASPDSCSSASVELVRSQPALAEQVEERAGVDRARSASPSARPRAG